MTPVPLQAQHRARSIGAVSLLRALAWALWRSSGIWSKLSCCARQHGARLVSPEPPQWPHGYSNHSFPFRVRTLGSPA